MSYSCGINYFMKKTLFILTLAAAAFGCKKNNTTPQYDLTGTWALSSTSTNGQITTAANYPCLANDKLVFGSGNSATVSWDNSGTCWINPQHTQSFSATDGLVLNFTRQGNSLTLPPASSAASAGHATIENINGKLQMTLKDKVKITSQNTTNTYYDSNVYIKQ